MPRKPEGPTFASLCVLVPRAPGWQVDWAALWALWPDLAILDTCPQDPLHHGEGDVGTHTRMVVEALVASASWRALASEERAGLFFAALLHDVGKPAVTRHEEGGRITSRGHSRIGAAMARRLLWQAGAPFVWREALCGIIAAHQLPFWLIEREDPRRLAIETSWKCRPSHLCLHALADARGRFCQDQAAIEQNVALAEATFEEADCLDRPFAFANAESRVAFFERPDRDPHYVAHAEPRCTVTVMSGLPGAGKDTWIAANRPGLPVVSLDAIRETLGIPATGNQGRVVQAANEAARDHLRNGRDFVWNATNVTAQMRAKPLRLCRDYGAEAEIVYLEPSPQEVLTRNSARVAAVPARVVLDLARKMEPPGEWEAHRVIREVG